MRLIRLLKNDIAREAAEWVDEQLITQAQAENICSRYDVDYHQVKNHSFAYNVLIGLGYLFIGLALITLLGANWDELPRELRMFGLIAITIGTQSLSLRQYLKGNLASATNGFLLGNMFYGAAIILIAQIYHLGEHMPDGIFWWALGCIPFAILTTSRILTVQSMVLALIWFFVESSMGFYPALFPLFIISSLIVLIRGKQSILLLLTFIFSVGLWVEYSLSALWQDSHYFNFKVEHLAVSVSLFIFSYAFSHWLRLRKSVNAKDYAAVIALWSLRFTLIVMLILSFEEPWRALIKESWPHVFSMASIVIALSVMSLLVVAKTTKMKFIAALVVAYLSILTLVVSATNTEQAIIFQVLSNILLVIGGVILILKGVNAGTSHYFFLGVMCILLTAMMRYADLVGNYIGGAILFMVFSALLLGAAKYWKHITEQEGRS